MVGYKYWKKKNYREVTMRSRIRSYADSVRLTVMQVVFSICIASKHRDKLKDLS